VQASRHRTARCCIHRSACIGRIYLSWGGERTSEVVEFVFEDGRGVASVGIDPATGRGDTQCEYFNSFWDFVTFFDSFTLKFQNMVLGFGGMGTFSNIKQMRIQILCDKECSNPSIWS
jgi:hypothetical protein